jgi:TPR repeat protein
MENDYRSVATLFYVALRYYEGLVVVQNYNQAFKVFNLAAAKGHAGAKFYVGLCYWHGTGVDKNIESALECFNVAAVNGYSTAQLVLGELYEHGVGFKKNIETAIEWYKRAANLYDEKAKETLKRLMIQYPQFFEKKQSK